MHTQHKEVPNKEQAVVAEVSAAAVTSGKLTAWFWASNSAE
jgi:hypothetical protein